MTFLYQYDELSSLYIVYSNKHVFLINFICMSRHYLKYINHHVLWHGTTTSMSTAPPLLLASTVDVLRFDYLQSVITLWLSTVCDNVQQVLSSSVNTRLRNAEEAINSTGNKLGACTRWKLAVLFLRRNRQQSYKIQLSWIWLDIVLTRRRIRLW